MSAAAATVGKIEAYRPHTSPQRPNRRLGVVIALEIIRPQDRGRQSEVLEILASTPRSILPFAARGDELIGLLSPGVDPMTLFLSIALHRDLPGIRGAAVAGEVVITPDRPGEFNGQALWRARALLDEMRSDGRLLAIETGDRDRDGRLSILAPWLGEWLAELSPARRAVLEILLDNPRTGPARAAAALAKDSQTRISKQAISQFLRHSETRHMRSLLDIVRADATLPRPVTNPGS